jgi:hypothetical protein
LVDHWLVFTDHNGTENVKAFVFYTDFFPHNEASRQVRIFAVTYESANEEFRTGKMTNGLYATYITENQYQVIDVPEGLEAWTLG